MASEVSLCVSLMDHSHVCNGELCSVQCFYTVRSFLNNSSHSAYDGQIRSPRMQLQIRKQNSENATSNLET